MIPAIRVERLAKRYQIGQRDAVAGSFRELIVNAARAPMRRLRRLQGRDETGTFWALRDLSFDVRPGEVMGVMGRNGAGKSTLLKILSRITEPTAGRVTLQGRVASLLEVGTGFHPELTGRENVFLNGAILGMRRAEIYRKFDAIVEFAEVSRFIDTAVKHYSSGMYLRLAFAVAAHLDGEILLVDEVLAVGDVAFQKKCLGKMQDVSRGGRTVLFISHNMAALAGLCSHGLVLDSGRMAFEGSASDAVRYYLEHDLADASANWDLGAMPRNVDGLADRVRLERSSAVMSRSDGFMFGEALRFRVQVVSTTAIDHVKCAIGLDDMYGSRVVTFVSDAEISAHSSGRYEFDVTVPPFGLLPGKYMVSVSLLSGGQYHDYLVHFGAICVLPLDEQGEQRVEEHGERGPIAVPAMWRVSALPSGVLVP